MSIALRDAMIDALRTEISKQGLTQQQLGERLGEGQWWVSRRLTGQVRMSVPELVRFAVALGVDAASFLPEVDA